MCLKGEDMRLNDARTYKLNVEAAGYGDEEGFLKEDTDLTLTDGELLHAVVTCGIPGERLMPEYPGKGRAELIRRLSLMESSLDARGEYLRKSGRILELDESERSLVSYYLGMFITKLVSRKVYGIDYLVPLQNIQTEISQKSIRYRGKRRTDLIGYRTSENGSYSVWEARGRSNNSAQALEEGCRDAGEILSVCGQIPERADSCMTYYGARCLSVRIKKAFRASEGVELSFPLAAYFQAYYDTAFGLIRECYERESVRNRMILGEERIEAGIPVTKGRTLVIGMPRELFFALMEKEEETVLAAVSGLKGSDGISVAFS